MKNVCKLFGIIAVIAVIGFSMTACKDEPDTPDTPTETVVTVDTLPAFPTDSTPAGTKDAAEAILADLMETSILSSIWDEIDEVVDANKPKNGNFSFTNKSLHDGHVKVNASLTFNETNTGGFETLAAIEKEKNELFDEWDELYESNPSDPKLQEINDEIAILQNEINAIQFAAGNKANFSYNQNYKGELIKAITVGSVTVAQGSIREMKYSGGSNTTVTEVGALEEFRANFNSSGKQQIIMGLTVTTSSGSVKIILDMNSEDSNTGNNVKLYGDDENDTYTETEIYSGSLKVYGSNNTLLIDHKITDETSYWEVYDIIGDF
ncbi:MAG: hypothetical protein FWB95_08410 [Treponema sp.]|nr:hypothetical protein [Treponema sp.]